MKHFITIFLMFLTVFSYSQEVWNEILKINTFEIIKDKNSIPTSILKKTKIGDVSKVANPNKKWNSSCIQSKDDDTPTAKLNWAATDNENWIISITTGGFMVVTNYFLIAKGLPMEQIAIDGWDDLNFATFRSKYIERNLAEK